MEKSTRSLLFVSAPEDVTKGQMMDKFAPEGLSYGKSSDEPGPWMLLGMPLEFAQALVKELDGLRLGELSQSVRDLLRAADLDRSDRLK